MMSGFKHRLRHGDLEGVLAKDAYWPKVEHWTGRRKCSLQENTMIGRGKQEWKFVFSDRGDRMCCDKFQTALLATVI